VANALLFAMLALQPVNRLVRFFGYAVVGTTVFCKVIDVPNFPFVTMLVIGATVLLIAFFYSVICSMIEEAVNEQR
jgi:hypothetical protein